MLCAEPVARHPLVEVGQGMHVVGGQIRIEKVIVGEPRCLLISPDAGFDAVPDALPDAFPEIVPDAAPDALPDAGPDAVHDAGPEPVPGPAPTSL